MDLAESDATYCSEVEKENISQLRRSKRLSQRLSQSFRSDEDPVLQRFEDIHRMLEIDCFQGYTKEDWCDLKDEIHSLRNSLRYVPRSKLMFVIKKIEQNLRILRIDTNLQEFSKLANENSNQLEEGISSESVKSPNVLAGMTTELLTEIPPYQPNNIGMNLNTATTGCTQVNPLDLTKKLMNVGPQTKDLLNDDPKDKFVKSDLLRCTTIDLTKNSQNKENIAPRNDCTRFNNEKKKESGAVLHTSKWLKYLPTQQRPQEICTKSNTPLLPKDKPTPFRRSLISLYKDTSIITAHKSKQSKAKHRQPNVRSGTKSKQKRVPKRPSDPQYLRNTETLFSRHGRELKSLKQRNAQTENFSNLSQELSFGGIGQDVLTFSDNNSSESIPISLKKSFKEVFGLDILDVLGCEKIAYSLTERHVERLANALNVQSASLKVTIEKILVDDDCTGFNENDQSDASVLECSQSPTPRLHPSQR